MPHFICNRRQFVRLFEHPLAERLTHGVFWLPACFYLPIIALLAWSAYHSQGSIKMLGGLSFGLLGLWPLTEYLLHRWGFHFKPRTPWQQRLQFQLHGVHHDYPRDQHRPVIPLPFSLV